MKKVNKIKYLFLGLITTLSFVCIGNAAFWNTEIKNVSGTPTTDSSSYIPVCYAGNKTYRSIEAAIADVGAPSKATTIYVYPNLTNYDGSRRTVYINSDITINNNVTLCLPYSETKYDAGDSWNSETNSDGNTFSIYRSFADSDSIKYPTTAIEDENGEITGYTNMTVGTARTTLVKLNDDKKITIESGGKLQIGGQCGYQNQYNVSGCVNGNYAELRLGNGSQIIAESGATIDCYGYIKQDIENSETDPDDLEMVILESGATLNTMLTIYDFKGGTRTIGTSGNGGLNAKGIMPFYLYDITNIQSKMKIHFGAKLFVSGRILVGGSAFNRQLQFFGTESDANALFQMKNGYSCYEYIPSDREREVTDIHGTTKIEIFGSCAFNKIVLSVSILIFNVTIDSSNFDFAINHKLRISLNKIPDSDAEVNFEVKNSLKLLPGSEIIINEGVNLKISSAKRIIIYPTFKYANGAKLDSRWGNYGEPIFICNGSVYSDNGGYVVGKVTTKSNTGILDARNFSVLSSTTKEAPGDNFYSAHSGSYPESVSLSGPTADSINTNLEKNKYLSKGRYWEIDASAALENSASINYSSESGLTLSDGKYSTGKGAGGSIVLTAANVSTYYPVKSYAWTVNNSGGTLSFPDNNSNSPSATLTINANDTTNSVNDVVVTLVVTFDGGQPPSVTKESLPFVRTPKDSSGPCFETGTLVLTNNGEKPIEQLNENDLLVSFNHFTGEYEYTKIGSLVFHGNNCYDVIELNFNDGTYIGFIDNHGLFDIDLNKYIDITIDNYEQYIGHRFVKYNEGTTKVVTLNNVNITKKYTGSYSVFANEHINCVAEGLLTLPTALYGLYNIFDYSENMTYDSEMVKRDIEQYGLFSYEEFKDIIPYNIFEAFGFKYFKVSIGKGLMTYEQLIGYIEWFFDIAKEGGVLIGL